MSQTSAQAAFISLVQNISATVVAGTYARVAAIPMLAHYTSVEALGNILRSGQFWFSSIPDMARVDTSEIIEGTQIVSSALRTLGPQLIRTIPYEQLNAAFSFNELSAPLLSETYAISLCEHGNDERTDRLTMWLEYGHRGHGVCLVLRKETMLGQTAAGRFPVHWAPIDYDSPEQLNERVRHLLSLVEREISRISPGLKALIAPALGPFIARCMVPLVIGHKNPAYFDEREVRFVRTPLIDIAPTPPDCVYRNIRTLEKPKRIFALALREYGEFGIDASMRTLLDHIIVGPSANQEKVSIETRALLDANGLGHVDVRLSKIPFKAA